MPDEVQQEAVRRVCGALGLREQYDAAVAAGELLELLESLPRGTVEASIRLMRGYTRTGEWPEPILPSPALVPPSAYPMRERPPVPVPSPLRAAMRPPPSLLQNPAKVGTCLSSTQP